MAILSASSGDARRGPDGRRVGRWTGRVVAGLVLLATASGGGCFVLEALGLRDAPLQFSHARHLEEGLDCASCHASYDASDAAVWPAAEQCALCHEGLDEGKAPERQVASLFAGGAFRAQHVTALSDEVIFSHGTHIDAGASCEQCHAGIETAEAVTPALAVGMDDCQACHTALNVEAEQCSTCHTRIDLATPPMNHAHEWSRIHGQAVRAGLSGPANDCAMCHTDSACITCHQDEPPANHNNTWRLRTHGVMAAMDRDNCSVCHTSDSCETCHSEAQPLSHRGPFGAPMDTHCVSCHEPLAATSCFTCHKTTDSHLLAPPKPSVPPHSAALDCRSCHGITASLPHVDNGDDCNSCHH